MKNPAPAIFPPAGIGDRKPANQAVLDWVHEVELLTQPENIFWCDGSEAENEFVISESLKQNVLFKLNEAKLPERIRSATIAPEAAAVCAPYQKQATIALTRAGMLAPQIPNEARASTGCYPAATGPLDPGFRPDGGSARSSRTCATWTGAGYRVRTDDIQLGKLTLYQLS